MSELTLGHSGTTRLASHWTNWGQWLALITMTVDHVTRYLFPEAWGMGWASSSIGRVAFPLFAAMVAWHGLFNTRNVYRYAWRIVIIGLFAQIPYTLMPRDGFQLNICFTLAAGLVWGHWLCVQADRLRRGEAPVAITLTLAALSVSAWAAVGFLVEYHHLGLLLIPAFMLAFRALTHAENRSEPYVMPSLWSLVATLPVLAVALSMNSSVLAKSTTLATTVAMLLLAAGAASLIPKVAYNMPRKLWLAWYPAHFAVIAALFYALDMA